MERAIACPRIAGALFNTHERWYLERIAQALEAVGYRTFLPSCSLRWGRSATMSYLPIAQALPPAMQRQLAWRAVLVGFMVAVVLMLLGGGVVRRFHLSLAVLLMGVGVTYFVLAIPMLLAGPSDHSSPTHIKESLRLAISPLAVPALISPLAVALLFSVSAFVPSLAAALIFVGIVVAVLIIDLGLLLLSTYVARYLTKPILEVLQKIFGFILLTFGIQLVLQALAKLGIMMATGF